VKLHSMLAVPMAVIMLITIVLVGVLSAGSIGSWRDGQAALGRMQQLRLLMAVQEALGLERAPTDSALSAASIASPALNAKLVECRQASDRQLHEFAALPGLPDRVGTTLQELSMRLAQTRANADAVLRQPVDQRSLTAVDAAIEGMMTLPSLLFPAADQILLEISAADPSVATMLTATRTASDLRLFGGSIAARFAQAMAIRQPIKPIDVDAIQVQEGQVLELHRMLLASIRIANVGDRTSDVVAAMDQSYFEVGQRIIDQLIDQAVGEGRFPVTHAEFAAEFRPRLVTLIKVRDRLFALTLQAMQAEQTGRLRRAMATAAVGAAVLLAVLAALLMLHGWVIRPLAELAAMIIRLAEGDRSVQLTVRRGSHEIAELASAIEVLRVATIEADAAAARRRVELQRWTAQLRQVLDTIDLMHARAVTITDVLPALLEQLAALGQADATAVPGLAAAIAATRVGIAALRNAEGQLDAALQRMHALGDGRDMRIDKLTTAMDEVARVVTAIQDSVNDVPQITLCAIRDLSARSSLASRATRGASRMAHERILAQVQEMAAAAGGLQSALKQATHGLGELSRLRA
jgi:hypothetical protein